MNTVHLVYSNSFYEYKIKCILYKTEYYSTSNVGCKSIIII